MSHPYVEVLKTYIRGCNRGDEVLLRSTLADDVIVYFLHIPPSVGRESLVELWRE